MSNQERIKEYLVGKEKDGKHIEGYLEKELSNNKVIMLSGKWGSGKTHFWQNEIVPSLNNEKSKIPNHYISLYGKTSIEEIKSGIFLKVFESVDSFESEEKTKNIVKNSLDIVSSLTKTVSVFGMSLDLSKVTDKSFEKIDNLLDNEKLKRTEKYLNNGAIICIDDFERKSKDIDLNDLFGFITQLTLNFNCKIVIILNDDVFEGEEKNIFSNVKEKSVSKFLMYNPSIENLFDSIFDNNHYYIMLNEYKEVILKTIEETKELNARIYIQVLDNLLEWIDNNETEKTDEIIRCLILVNINFILFHTIGILKNQCFIVKNFNNREIEYHSNRIHRIHRTEFDDFNEYYINIMDSIINSNDYSEERIKDNKLYIEKNKVFYESEYFINNFKIYEDIDNNIQNKINNFIETGIL